MLASYSKLLKGSPYKKNEAWAHYFISGMNVQSGVKMSANQRLRPCDCGTPSERNRFGQTQKGIEAIKGENTWWVENHEMHGGEVDGSFLDGNQSIVQFNNDVTPQQTGNRMTMG